MCPFMPAPHRLKVALMDVKFLVLLASLQGAEHSPAARGSPENERSRELSGWTGNVYQQGRCFGPRVWAGHLQQLLDHSLLMRNPQLVNTQMFAEQRGQCIGITRFVRTHMTGYNFWLGHFPSVWVWDMFVTPVMAHFPCL